MSGKGAKRLGEDTLRMVKMVKKHKVAFAPINISQELREQLPAWQHLGVEKQIPQNPRSGCLAKNHESRRVKNMIRIMDRLQGEYREGLHFPVFSCHCNDCTEDQRKGCKKPQ
jgi:hypothetical protein